MNLVHKKSQKKNGYRVNALASADCGQVERVYGAEGRKCFGLINTLYGVIASLV